VIKEKLGSRVDSVVHALFPFLFKRAVNPDALTVLGALISVGAALAFSLGHFPLGGVLMLAGGFFDLVDGVVARHFGISTTFGGFLDSTLDRFVDMVVLLGIVIFYAGIGERGIAGLGAVVLISTVLTSYAKARAELHLDHLPGGMLERGERVGLLAAGSILGFMIPVLWLLAIGTTFTAAQRLWVAHREMAILDRSRTAGVTGAAEGT
jgi:CDP-diacylglycerol--glycerol-3-phosphate 3-phosphatidyltransferase